MRLNYSYELTYYTVVKTSFFNQKWDQKVEYVKTTEDLKVFLEIIKLDESIVRAFYQDRSNGVITQIKSPSDTNIS
jgi:hypothetical protein